MPISAHIRETYPNTRALNSRYREGNKPLAFGDGAPVHGNHPAIVGQAFDLLVRFVLDSRHLPGIALGETLGRNLLDLAEAAVDHLHKHPPSPAEALDPEAAAAAWVLAYTTEASRIGVRPESPLAPYFTGGGRLDDLLALAQPEDVRELALLHDTAIRHFYPDLPRRLHQLHLGPTFAGSVYCPADADLIVGGTLIDTKTCLGRKVKTTGGREDELRADDVRALLGYVLFDLDDEYQLDTIGFYSARFGRNFRMELPEFLSTLADGPVDLPAARDRMRAILTRS